MFDLDLGNSVKRVVPGGDVGGLVVGRSVPGGDIGNARDADRDQRNCAGGYNRIDFPTRR